MLCRARKQGKVRDQSGLNERCMRAVAQAGAKTTGCATRGDFPSDY